MQVVLKYELPEEKEEWTMAMDGRKYHAIVRDYLDHLREQTKYNQNEEEASRAEASRSIIIELMEKHNVSIL